MTTIYDQNKPFIPAGTHVLALKRGKGEDDLEAVKEWYNAAKDGDYWTLNRFINRFNIVRDAFPETWEGQVYQFLINRGWWVDLILRDTQGGTGKKGEKVRHTCGYITANLSHMMPDWVPSHAARRPKTLACILAVCKTVNRRGLDSLPPMLKELENIPDRILEKDWKAAELRVFG